LGFGIGLGAILVQMVFLAVGMVFFFWGLWLLAQERKKAKADQSQEKKILAYAVMFIGVMFGLGLGAGFLFSAVFEDMMDG